jgi:hypothetical protein
MKYTNRNFESNLRLSDTNPFIYIVWMKKISNEIDEIE